jgi:hypothetical protein
MSSTEWCRAVREFASRANTTNAPTNVILPRLTIQGFDVHREFEFAIAGALGLNRHESQ